MAQAEYTENGLTVTKLAVKMQMPEHQLRTVTVNFPWRWEITS